MANILITGAIGNIGTEVIESILTNDTQNKIYAGVRDIEKARHTFWQYPQLNYRAFDFEDSTTYPMALNNIDIVFLLRPPHITDIKKFIQPFFEEMQEKNISKIVFLSVQDADKNKYFPHFKIEKLIEQFKFNFIHIRPGYFMQNLTTTLIDEIESKNRIYIPAKNLKLNWIDAKDIGLASASALANFDKYKNRAFEITGDKCLDFKEVAETISKKTNHKVSYVSPNLLRFFINERRKSKAFMLIIIMILLHYVPAIQHTQPNITQDFTELTGKKPHSLSDFIVREKSLFQ